MQQSLSARLASRLASFAIVPKTTNGMFLEGRMHKREKTVFKAHHFMYTK
jgi:hypothetical protein